MYLHVSQEVLFFVHLLAVLNGRVQGTLPDSYSSGDLSRENLERIPPERHESTDSPPSTQWFDEWQEWSEKWTREKNTPWKSRSIKRSRKCWGKSRWEQRASSTWRRTRKSAVCWPKTTRQASQESSIANKGIENNSGQNKVNISFFFHRKNVAVTSNEMLISERYWCNQEYYERVPIILCAMDVEFFYGKGQRITQYLGAEFVHWMKDLTLITYYGWQSSKIISSKYIFLLFRQ